MSFLEKLLSAKPVRTPLEFGINENVRLTKIDNEVRKYDGEIIKRNCFITFTKFDSKGEAMAASEFAYFNLDHTADYFGDNIATQIGQLQDIVNVLNPGFVIDPSDIYEGDEDVMEEGLSNKKGVKMFQDRIFELLEEGIGESVGSESPLMRVKVVTDTKGKWLQLPRETHIVESSDSECTMSITAYELKNKAKGLEAPKEEADSKGSAPDEVADKPKKKKALRNL